MKINTEEKVEFDKSFLDGNTKYVAGVDEVGRGPLAGPVVCAAVIMPFDDIIIGVDDSKKLSEKKRETLATQIKDKAVAYCIAEVQPDKIDELNILQATLFCMAQAVNGLKVKPDVLLVDALIPSVDCKTIGIIKGDAKSYNIGAASIIAKVYRDNLMRDYAATYPEYGFDRNKGYGTKEHITALKEVGYCKIHRKTFIKNFSVEKERKPF